MNSSETWKTYQRVDGVHHPVQIQTLPLSPTNEVLGLPPRKPLLIHQCKKWQARKWQARECQREKETARTGERYGHRHASESPSTLAGESDDGGNDAVWDDVDALEESLGGETDEEGSMDNEDKDGDHEEDEEDPDEEGTI